MKYNILKAALFCGFLGAVGFAQSNIREGLANDLEDQAIKAMRLVHTSPALASQKSDDLRADINRAIRGSELFPEEVSNARKYCDSIKYALRRGVERNLLYE